MSRLSGRLYFMKTLYLWTILESLAYIRRHYFFIVSSIMIWKVPRGTLIAISKMLGDNDLKSN